MAQADTGIALQVQEAVKTYGSGTKAINALKNISLDIKNNEFFTLLGPSGCGKTTLLRMIAGFEEPTAGTITLHGVDIQSMPAHKRRVNTVFQNYALFTHMTIAQNIAYGLENLEWERSKIKNRVSEMLSLVHMESFKDRRPDQLSGGQQQRVALARALAPEPEMLLLDEPLSALDLKLRQAMRTELRNLQKQTGITFVFVTHDQEEALDMSDRICVLGDGVIQQLGTPDEIYENPANRFVAGFIGDTNFMEADVLDVDSTHATVRISTGLEIKAQQKNVRMNSKAFVSLRPEKINLQEQATSGIILDGKILSQNYLGGYTHYSIQVGDINLRASKRNNVSNNTIYEIGSTVKVGFQESSARILGE
jgi:spermidine/putrescine transport system ATP-binding protein